MTEELLEKGKDLQSIINTLKGSVVKIDTMSPGLDTTTITIAIVKDPKVIAVIRKALNVCIDEKQEEFSKLKDMDTRNHSNVEGQKVINFNEEYRVPAGSDYDLDKVRVNKHIWTTATTLATLKEIVHDGAFNGRSFESICCELIALHECKNKDYGGAFDKSMSKFGVVSLLIRLNDKFERLESLFKNGKAEVTDESFEDTLRDIACYAIMGLEHLYNTSKND